jgi:hypothetical protein
MGGRVPSTRPATALARPFSFEHVRCGPAFHGVNHTYRLLIRIVAVGLNGVRNEIAPPRSESRDMRLIILGELV